MNKFKKLLSFATAAALSVSAFAGLATTAGAKTVNKDTLWEDTFESYTTDSDLGWTLPTDANTYGATVQLLENKAGNDTKFIAIYGNNTSRGVAAHYTPKDKDSNDLVISDNFTFEADVNLGLGNNSSSTTHLYFRTGNPASNNNAASNYLLDLKIDTADGAYSAVTTAAENNSVELGKSAKGTTNTSIAYTNISKDYAVSGWHKVKADFDFTSGKVAITLDNVSKGTLNLNGTQFTGLSVLTGNKYYGNVELDNIEVYKVLSTTYDIIKDETEATITLDPDKTTGLNPGDAVSFTVAPTDSSKKAAFRVTDEAGNEIDVTNNTESYSFTMPEGDVTITAYAMEQTSHVYSVKAVSGTTVLATLAYGNAEKDETYGASGLSEVIENDGKFYQLDSSVTNHTVSYTMGEEDAEKTVPYVEKSDIVYFVEAETIPDDTSNYGWGAADDGNLSGRKSQSVKGTNKQLSYNFTLAEDGEYKVTAPYGTNDKNRTTQVLFDNTLAKSLAVGKDTSGTHEVTVSLKAGKHTVAFRAYESTINAIDYVLITKTGDYSAHSVKIEEANVDTTVGSGLKYTLPAAVEKGNYVFAGWSDGATTYNASQVIDITEDKEFTAVYSGLSATTASINGVTTGDEDADNYLSNYEDVLIPENDADKPKVATAVSASFTATDIAYNNPQIEWTITYDASAESEDTGKTIKTKAVEYPNAKLAANSTEKFGAVFTGVNLNNYDYQKNTGITAVMSEKAAQ